MRGFAHLYCGDGKGKTTAAVGLSVRASGAGKSVLFTQFLKDGSSSELNVLRALPNVKVLCCERNFGFFRSMAFPQTTQCTIMLYLRSRRCVGQSYML